MLLATLWREHPDELRADLQQVFGIDIEAAMAGGHSAAHVAALAKKLPLDARVNVAVEPDARWTQTDVLLASLVNLLSGLIWGMADRRSRGPAPKPIGPSYMMRGGAKSLPAQAMSASALMEELSKPREAVT